MTRPLLFLRIIVGIILTITVNLCSVPAHAAECFPSPEAVRARYPGASSRYSHHVKDHQGELCWFPDRKEVMRHASDPIRVNQVSESRPLSATGADEPMRDALANHLLEIGRMIGLPKQDAADALREYGKRLIAQEGR